MRPRVNRIISGGQTGVDRAALEVASEFGVPCGGWCPRGRWAEDGAIPGGYPMSETPLSDPAQRTEWNVRDSEGTLVLHRGRLTGGTALTMEMAEKLGKPVLEFDLKESDWQRVVQWIVGSGVGILNVAGPRESQEPGIASEAGDLLRKIFKQLESMDGWEDDGTR